MLLMKCSIKNKLKQHIYTVFTTCTTIKTAASHLKQKDKQTSKPNKGHDRDLQVPFCISKLDERISISLLLINFEVHKKSFEYFT